jgi:FAD/FMN-containing dehydrogenase
MSGGYVQGGVHSPLLSTHGLAADIVLEWDIVIANGSRITATPDHHADLYWALSGGGGGTFAVVVSMTTRMHCDNQPTVSAGDPENTTTGRIYDF